MQKILSLTAKQFFTGINTSYFMDNAGIFAKGQYLNPFVNPFTESVDTGLLQTSGSPHDITGAVVDNILNGVSKVTSATVGNLYMVGSAGHFYVKDLSSDANTPTDRRSGSTISATMANGLGLFQSTTGGSTEYLYYFTKNTIGRWDLNDSWTDEWSSSLNSTLYHPTHFFKGALWFGNGNTIGSIYDVSGTITTSYSTSPGGLGLPNGFTVSVLEDDGDFLIAGITKQPSSGSNILRNDTRIIFWDTVSQNFNKEWEIPEYSISGIDKFEDGFVAYGGRAIWFFNYSNKPEKLRNLDSAGALPFLTPYAADVWNDAIIWGGGSTFLNTYGKVVPDMTRAYFQPFAGLDAQATFVKSSVEVNDIFVGTAGPKFWYIKPSESGTATGTTPETIYFNLKGEWELYKLEILLGKALGVTDSLIIQVQTDESSSAQTWGTVAYDASLNQPVQTRVILSPATLVIATQVKFLLNFSAGNVKIREINLYGKPVRRILD